MPDPAAIENQVVHRIKFGRHRPAKHLRCRKVQIALQLEHRSAGAGFTEGAGHLGCAPTFRACSSSVVPAAYDRGIRQVRPVWMQPEPLGELLADRHSTDTVSATVERWGEYGDSQLTGDHGDDSPGNAALGRHADPEYPFTCEVVHTACAHHAETRTTCSSSSARWPVSGLTPRLARVAAITPRYRDNQPASNTGESRDRARTTSAGPMSSARMK